MLLSSSAKADDPVPQACDYWMARPEPVIGPRFARTRWRAMTSRAMTSARDASIYRSPGTSGLLAFDRA
jgi:hypothetical protein